MAAGEPPRRLRLDQLVLARELAPSRQQAQALILAGRILVDEQKLTKPGHMVPADAVLRRLGEPPRFASRAGWKLEAALDHFHVEVRGRVALDVGSSTGGFTDCLLQRGAARVHAVDSGSNQMIWRLRSDPRVHLREKTNARHLQPAGLGEPVSLLTVDVSFISVTLLLPALLPCLAPGGEAIILVKPQFEAGRAQVGKGGIIRDESVRLAAVERVRAAVTAAGATVTGVLPSPLLGADGNQEYLLHALTPNP
jgi:23S rRNA (cytidine1920-2'-O)/16S rRNA (cytidine1409-2'-O)-methyltransferase